MGVLDYTTAKTNELLKKCENMPSGGVSGKTPVLETGTTTTLASGNNATSEVVRSGEDASGNPKYKLNFGIPKGKDGTGGSGGGVVDSVDWENVLNKPSWVNGGTKPAYTATEVGALPSTITIPSKTSELDNDSDFIRSGDLKTINGNSIVGSGNIEIAGSGGGIADAPNDGSSYARKNETWVQTDIVEISDIIDTFSDGNEMPLEKFNKLKKYVEDGKILSVNNGGTCSLLTASFDGTRITLIASLPMGGYTMVAYFKIDATTRICTTEQENVLGMYMAGEGILTGYSKKTSYTAIKDSDSINTAIGKLEAGLGSGGSGSSMYMLPSTILALTNESTPAEILTAFGENGFQEILNAAKANKFFYIVEGTSTIKRTVYPVFLTITIASTLIGMDISVPKKDGKININISGATSSPKCSKKELYDNGYILKIELYSLTSNSSTADIATAVDGETGLNDIINAADAGNRFIIAGVMDLSKARIEVSIMYGMEENGNISVLFSGISYGLFGGMGGALMISFDKATGTFSATSINIAGP